MLQVLYFMSIFQFFSHSEGSLWYIVEEGGFLWKETLVQCPAPLPQNTIDFFSPSLSRPSVGKLSLLFSSRVNWVGHVSLSTAPRLVHHKNEWNCTSLHVFVACTGRNLPFTLSLQAGGPHLVGHI